MQNHNTLLHAVSVFSDNYVWILQNADLVVIIDPGDAEPVLEFLSHRHLNPTAILITHKHNDHIKGVLSLKRHYPHLMVYGPPEVAEKLPDCDVRPLTRVISVGDFNFTVISVPGHTQEHVAYYCEPYLFCGDTLFSAGCGRILKDCAKEMYESLQRLAALPDKTVVCCAHEYTVSNLRFAHHLLPGDAIIAKAMKQAEQKRLNGEMTLPSTIEYEKRVNVFLNCDSLPIKDLFGKDLDSWERFAALRKRKDEF